MQVAQGVFQFKVPMPPNPLIPNGRLRYTLVYALHTASGWVIIDAGSDTDEGFRAFQTQLSEAGITPQEVGIIIITHGHPDHVGLARRVKELTGAPVAMHKLDAPGSGHDPSGKTVRDRTLFRRWMERYGVPPQERGDDHNYRHRKRGRKPLEVDILLEGGEELLPGSQLWAVWTPGHTEGHLCVHDVSRRLFFSGDHVLPTITPHVSLYPGESSNPLGQFVSALKSLRELDVETVHPAHEYSFPDLRNRVQELLDHHDHRLQEILDQVTNHPKTPYQISAGITWNVAPWDLLHPTTKRMAVMETLAHLHYLMEEGRLILHEADGFLMYGLPA